MHDHQTGERPRIERVDKRPPPEKAQLRAWLQESGGAVAAWLERAFRRETAPQMFGKDPVRWLGDLLTHEAHHRGQIHLALKQSGHKLPDNLALQGLWGRWIFGA